MKNKSLTVLLTAAALGLSAGCASTSSLPGWSRTPGFFHRGSEPSGDPDKSALASSKGESRAAQKEEVSPEFRAAQKTFKNTEKTLLAWARYQEDIGEYAEARKMYHELQIAYPRNLDAQLGMARIEQLTGRSEQAEQILSELKNQFPNNSAVMVELGRLYSTQEDWSRAIREFEAACDVEPSDQNCRYELGVALAHAGQFDQALSHLKFAVGAPAANYNIGYILHEQGKDADAVEWIQNALQMHPDQRTAEKSKVLLAKILPPSTHPSGAAGIAQHPAPSAEVVSSAGDFGTDGHPSQSRSIASQFSPAPIVTNRRAQTPSTATVYAGSGPGFAGAAPENVMPGNSQPSGQSRAPFNTVSYSQSDAAGKAGYSSAPPPQWNGPSRMTSSHTSSQASESPAAPQDPPNWRARKN